MEITYTASFIRLLKSLPKALREEVREKINLFRDPKNHQQLKVHKLKGRLKGRYSFSVNYKTRIVFNYSDNTHKEVRLDAIGDHHIYD